MWWKHIGIGLICRILSEARNPFRYFWGLTVEGDAVRLWILVPWSRSGPAHIGLFDSASTCQCWGFVLIKHLQKIHPKVWHSAACEYLGALAPLII